MGDWRLKAEHVHPSCSYVRYTAHSCRIHCRRYSGTHQFLALASKATSCGKFSLRRFINSTRMGSNSSTLRRWKICIIHSSDVGQNFEILFPFCLFVVSLTKLISLSYATMQHFETFWKIGWSNFLSKCKMHFFNETSSSWTSFSCTFTEKRVEASWVIPPILSISFLIKSLPQQFHLKTRNWLKMESQRWKHNSELEHRAVGSVWTPITPVTPLVQTGHLNVIPMWHVLQE